MIALGRRNDLKLGASLMAAAATGLTASPLAHAAPTEARSLANIGVYRYPVGDLTVTAIQDGAFVRPVDGFVTNAGPVELEEALRLKTLKGLTPYEFICRPWTVEPEIFIINPIHQMPGLNT